ncbi:hypothetical protein MHY85_10595 [Cellulomonas sp. ACRRI]|uniref:hypothetical protein n=1 Tax=Cellulomonas sp. ACRRI TaxID=2918188 RepID=UPI001EF20AB8|nr:hypothetical protein [Cellulomonas sp. ACRRI]MCG7286417.1 hypothetical protein [Cellulomonas sp. ACRRI]
MTEEWRPSIPRVVDAYGKSWTPEEVERDPGRVHRDGLRCAGCGVEATWQAAHTKVERRTGQPVDVHLHFKLKRHGSEHGAACPFDFHRRATDLVRAFPDIVRRRSGAYQLRLPLSSMPDGSDPRPGSRRSAPDLGPGAGQVLSAALRILLLLENFADQPRAQEQFRAQYGDLADIGWGDFCWRANTSGRAQELVDELRRPERQVYPIAVWGLARPPVTNGTGTQYVTLTHTRQGQTAARIRARGPEVLSSYSAAQLQGQARHVIGYGEWRAALLGDRRRGAIQADDREAAVEAVLWVHHPSAVAWW